MTQRVSDEQAQNTIDDPYAGVAQFYKDLAADLLDCRAALAARDRVVEASIAAYNELESFGSETVGYFYDHAKPVIRDWALATKAVRDRKSVV